MALSVSLLFPTYVICVGASCLWCASEYGGVTIADPFRVIGIVFAGRYADFATTWKVMTD